MRVLVCDECGKRYKVRRGHPREALSCLCGAGSWTEADSL